MLKKLVIILVIFWFFDFLFLLLCVLVVLFIILVVSRFFIRFIIVIDNEYGKIIWSVFKLKGMLGIKKWGKVCLILFKLFIVFMLDFVYIYNVVKIIIVINGVGIVL